MKSIREKEQQIQTLFLSPGLHRAVLLAQPWILG